MNTLPQELQLSYHQHTLNDSFTCMGRGLHSGLKVIMTVMPAEPNSGYRFIRRDISPDRNEIHATWHTVTDTHLCTTVSNHLGVRVSTIEHLIAALHASGIDNALIVLDGPEVPIMDGSSKTYMQLIASVGLAVQQEERHAIVITDTVTVMDCEKQASFSPYPISWMDILIDFESPVIGKQSLSLPINKTVFAKELANARTFGFAEHIATLKELGFVRGGSLANAVLVNDKGVVNVEGLRYRNEFVRHKMLDSVGDLALAGAPIIGKFSAKYPGHKLNNQLLRELMLAEESYRYVSVRKIKQLWSFIFNEESNALH